MNPRPKGEAILAIYSVYGDESYDEKKERVFALAGVFGLQEHWDRLISKWTDITKGKEFHATEWEPERPKDYISLVRAVAESRLHGWGVGMSLIDKRTIFDRAKKNFEYYICFVRVIDHFAEYTRLCLPQGTTDFTFDHINNGIEYNAGLLYAEMGNAPEWRGSEFIEKDVTYASRKNPKIQVADMWAREVMKHTDRTIISSPPLPMRRSFQVLRKNKLFSLDMVDKSYFEDMKRKVQDNRPGLDKYYGWLAKHRRQDNTENRIRFEIYLNWVERKKRQ